MNKKKKINEEITTEIYIKLTKPVLIHGEAREYTARSIKVLGYPAYESQLRFKFIDNADEAVNSDHELTSSEVHVNITTFEFGVGTYTDILFFSIDYSPNTLRNKKVEIIPLGRYIYPYKPTNFDSVDPKGHIKNIGRPKPYNTLKLKDIFRKHDMLVR